PCTPPPPGFRSPRQHGTFTFADSETRRWDVVLSAGPTIRGRLVDEAGRPLARWWIHTPAVRGACAPTARDASSWPTARRATPERTRLVPVVGSAERDAVELDLPTGGRNRAHDRPAVRRAVSAPPTHPTRTPAARSHGR